jgi:DNA-binding IclR family transcriptional regulator
MQRQSQQGAQSIERAIAIVRSIARVQHDGARLVDVARDVGVTKSTASRILQALARAGWIEQSKERGRFYLGIELYALKLTAASRHEIIGLGERAVTRLAELIGDTVYFQVPIGYDSICLARCEGKYPVKILTVDVGARRPLGMGAGNVAILAALANDEVERTIVANIEELGTYVAPGVELDPAILWRLVRETRLVGHSLIHDIFIPGMGAIGIPIIGPGGAPVGALSVAAITNRLQGERHSIIVTALQREVRTMEARLRKSVRATPAPVDILTEPIPKADAMA